MNPDFSELAPLLSHWGMRAFILKAIPGGLSGAHIWCVSHKEHTFCLRRWPSHHPAPGQLQTIHRLLQHIQHAGVKTVPLPHKTLRGETLVSNEGHLWELTPWYDGQPLSSRASTEQQRTAALEALARLHQTTATFSGTTSDTSPGLLKRRDHLAELLKGNLEQLSQAIRNESPSPTRETLLQLHSRIEDALPRAFATVEHCSKVPLPLQWCHGDVHPGNVLVQDNQVTGIIDFGAAAVDSAAGDIARLVGGLYCEPEARQRCIEAYARNRRMSDDEQRAITAFHVGGLISSAANWIRWLCIERSVPLANTTQARMEELIGQFTLIGSWGMEEMGGI